ncbi:hypothetical protein Vqi01_59810 [Micromonospora qiuiae]|uniref:Uncharacterized protein n=1 Tax=Micromonospora qiuiae TaxID=502268 RepID=A0ABQ4JMH3_9ACTN|nr:hypothetical protein Vqi01_59810 [Micromonospora qiuiae]
MLVRPHHRRDDITLATRAINDWAVQQVRGPGHHTVTAAPARQGRCAGASASAWALPVSVGIF